MTGTVHAVKVLDPSLHTTANRGVCIVQTIATYNYLSLPEIQTGFFSSINGNNRFCLNVTSKTGITFDDTLDPDVPACGADVACLQSYAADQNSNSTLMGHIVTKMVYDFSIRDGFNKLGTDGACETSCRAFRDVTGYTPQNNTYDAEARRAKNCGNLRWKTTAGGSFIAMSMSHQTLAVLPSFATCQTERTTRVATKPNYSKDRFTEAREAIRLMSELDDKKKIEI
ncbi:hypothetical protein ACA910_019616 [Epithemia clementina (nom. ined.)]